MTKPPPTSKTTVRENININTLLLTVVLALSGWTLKTVAELANKQAALTVQVSNLERVVYSVRE